jgi:C-terminal processing protease CtpA/Prc
LAAERDRSAQRNFDVNRVERLRGNVGYLELYGFEPPEFVGEVLAAAFTFLAHSRALILDLRHNRGGSPGTVALLCSYLLPAYPATHLNDLYCGPTTPPANGGPCLTSAVPAIWIARCTC